MPTFRLMPRHGPSSPLLIALAGIFAWSWRVLPVWQPGPNASFCAATCEDGTDGPVCDDKSCPGWSALVWLGMRAWCVPPASSGCGRKHPGRHGTCECLAPHGALACSGERRSTRIVFFIRAHRRV